MARASFSFKFKTKFFFIKKVQVLQEIIVKLPWDLEDVLNLVYWEMPKPFRPGDFREGLKAFHTMI